jgi:hypothetical protein
LGLQLPDRAIEARERLRPFVALVETFVDDDAERLDESETFGIGRAQTGGIVGALLAGSDLSIRTLTLLDGFAFVGLRRRRGKAERRRGHHSGSHGITADHAVSSARREHNTDDGRTCHAARECASVKFPYRSGAIRGLRGWRGR